MFHGKEKKISGDMVYFEAGSWADFFVKTKVITEESVKKNITEDEILAIYERRIGCSTQSIHAMMFVKSHPDYVYVGSVENFFMVRWKSQFEGFEKVKRPRTGLCLPVPGGYVWCFPRFLKIFLIIFCASFVILLMIGIWGGKVT